MRTLTLLPLFDIQLFAEGGDGGTGAGAAGQIGAAPAQPQATGAKGESLAEVHYGKPDPAPAAGEQSIPEDRSAKFDALIKGEYKAEYEARLKDTISRRLKGTEAIVAKYNQAQPVLSKLTQYYGVDAEDMAALDKAIDEDESFYQDEALESGLTVQQVKEKRKMLRENAELKAQLDAQATRKAGDELYAKWMQQAEQVKQIYPAFDLNTELQNEAFRNLLRSNIPIQTAFEVLHKDELIPAAMQFTAQQISQKVANDIRAGSRRPAEGAMKSQSTAVYKSDVSQLTDADMAEINRRVLRGEKIRF